MMLKLDWYDDVNVYNFDGNSCKIIFLVLVMWVNCEEMEV